MLLVVPSQVVKKRIQQHWSQNASGIFRGVPERKRLEKVSRRFDIAYAQKYFELKMISIKVSF